MSRASKPAKQNGTSSAETIRASGQRPRKQAGHKTAPDQHAKPSQTPCNAGAIHTGHRWRHQARAVIECRMISRTKSFIFVNIPKTAGNSLQGALLPYADDRVSLNPERLQDGV